MKDVGSNIWKLYIIKSLRWFMLIMPIIVLFFQQNGLSMKEILLLQSVFSIGIILFEIPSGSFSDVIGRKTTIIIGCFLGFVGVAALSLSHAFLGFLIAEILMSMGSSFLSGTDSAMLYDTLIQLNKEREYKKIEGKLLSAGNFSEAIASFAGGFLALISLRFPVYVQTLVFFLTVPIALTLIEPKRKRHVSKSLKDIVNVVKYAVHKNKQIKWLIFYSAFVNASTLTMVWFIQPYFKFVGLHLIYFGIIWGILSILGGIFSLYAYKVEEVLGKNASLASLILLSSLGYMLLSIFHTLWAIVFITLFYFVRGVSGPLLKDYINQLISSDIRATILSVKNLFDRLIFSIMGPIIGWLADVYSLSTALFSAGVIFLVLGVIPLLLIYKYNRI